MEIAKGRGEETGRIAGLNDPTVDEESGDGTGDVSLRGQPFDCFRFPLFYNPSICRDRFQSSLLLIMDVQDIQDKTEIPLTRILSCPSLPSKVVTKISVSPNQF